jgi:hypothetical protein
MTSFIWILSFIPIVLISLLISAILCSTPINAAQSSKELTVKILSPKSGQTVNPGVLTVTGTSSDNVTTNCKVLVDLNNLKPYQNSIATGAGGANDYSTWKFTYTSKYHLIQLGRNEITSKLTCVDNGGTSLAKWYSVNITGATSNTTPRNIVNTQKTQETSPSSSFTANTVNNKADSGNTSSKETIYRETIAATNQTGKPFTLSTHVMDAGKANTTSTPRRAISTSISTVPTTTNLSDNPVVKEDGKPFANTGVKENHKNTNPKHDSNKNTKENSDDTNTKNRSKHHEHDGADSHDNSRHRNHTPNDTHSKHHDSFFNGDTFFE